MPTFRCSVPVMGYVKAPSRAAAAEIFMDHLQAHADGENVEVEEVQVPCWNCRRDPPVRPDGLCVNCMAAAERAEVPR